MTIRTAAAHRPSYAARRPRGAHRGRRLARRPRLHAGHRRRERAPRAASETRWPTVPRDALGQGVDVVIAFGGDGTLLGAASAVAHSSADAPVLGVNLGRLGFLTEVSRAELMPALEALIAGRFRLETRLLLSGEVERDGQPFATHLALNDIVVTRGAFSRMIEIDVAIGGRSVCRVQADGLIVATRDGIDGLQPVGRRPDRASGSGRARADADRARTR